MKFNKPSQLLLVSFLGLAVASLLTACQLVTVDFVYVACSAGTASGSAGEIYTYAVDAHSGALRQDASPVDSGGTRPVAMATSSDYWHLYVANQGNNSVVHFTIDDHGKLTKKDSVTLSATPVSIAVSANSKYLYVVSGTSSATLTEYALSAGAIGSVVTSQALTLSGYSSDTIVPTGVTVLANSSAVYATVYDKSAYNPGGSTTSDANPGWIFGYSIGSGGALTAVSGSPYEAGVKPSSLTTDPANRFIYITDFASNEMIGYTVLSTDVLQLMVSGPFKTGNEPTAITIDPRGLYLYLSNALDNSVGGYTITLSSGAPSAAVSTSGTAATTTDTDPVSIVVEPALGSYVYTANYLGNTISGFHLDANTGTLSLAQATPYPTGAYPRAIVAVPHGNHSVQSAAQ